MKRTARRPATPRSETRPVRVDEYNWSRTTPTPALRRFLEAEESRCSGVFGRWGTQVRHLAEELDRHRPAPAAAATTRVGDWIYSHDVSPSGSDRVIRRAPTLNGQARTFELVVDDTENDGSRPGYRRTMTDVSTDGRVVAYSERYGSMVDHDICIGPPGGPFTHLARGVAAQFALSPDGKHVYYLTLDESQRPHQLWLVDVAEPDNRRLLYEESDPAYRMKVAKSRCATMLLASSRSLVDSAVFALPFERGHHATELREVRSRGEGALSSVEVVHDEGRVYIAGLQTREGRDEIWICDAGSATQPVRVRCREQLTLTKLQAFERGVALELRQRGQSFTGHLGIAEFLRIATEPARLHDLADISLRGIRSPGFRLGENASWASDTYIARSESLTQAPSAVRVPFAEDGDPTPAHPNSADAPYNEKRMEIVVRDGTRVPVYLAWRRSSAEASERPMLVRFYGSYGVISDPIFSPATMTLLDQGFTVALVQPRGGGELGSEWWAGGAQENKINTVNDVLDCVECLITSGYVKAGQVSLEAHSAGGFVAAAALIKMPHWFSTAVLTNPFIDPVGALTDPDLPLTVSDWSEWGNPQTSAADLERLLSLSPYDTLPDDCSQLPPILVVGSLDDTRVSIVEPAKFAARLRDRGGRVMLHTRFHSAHTFAGSREEASQETAALLSWLCNSGRAFDAP